MGNPEIRTETSPPRWPKRATKTLNKFSPTLGTTQTLGTGENNDPAACQKKSQRRNTAAAPASPTQQPRQDHGHAGETKEQLGASNPLAALPLLHMCHIIVYDFPSLVTQVFSHSAHRPLSMMEVQNLGP